MGKLFKLDITKVPSNYQVVADIIQHTHCELFFNEMIKILAYNQC